MDGEKGAGLEGGREQRGTQALLKLSSASPPTRPLPTCRPFLPNQT